MRHRAGSVPRSAYVRRNAYGARRNRYDNSVMEMIDVFHSGLHLQLHRLPLPQCIDAMEMSVGGGWPAEAVVKFGRMLKSMGWKYSEKIVKKGEDEDEDKGEEADDEKESITWTISTA